MGLISRVSSRTYRPSKMENQSNPKIIFILGGPGSGKGTQCEKIKQKYNYDHLSTGDLLRDVVKSGSELGIKIQAIMTAGQLVSDDLILCLVKDAIYKNGNKNGVLIDGYPRNIEQAKLFESKIGYPDSPEAPLCTLVLLTVCRRRSLPLLHPPSRSRSLLHQRGSTLSGSEDPSLLPSPPSSRCGSPSRSMMSAAHPLSTASASKYKLI